MTTVYVYYALKIKVLRANLDNSFQFCLTRFDTLYVNWPVTRYFHAIAALLVHDHIEDSYRKGQRQRRQVAGAR
jgi:hypothetical protein